MKSKFRTVLLSLTSLFLFISTVPAQVAAGGDFTLTQKVIAGGGSESTDATNMLFKIEGTTGQNAVGARMDGGDFILLGGFWHAPEFAPTTAGVSISGRVMLENEPKSGLGKLSGLPNAVLILTGGLLTAPRVTRTNQFGNFSFEEIESGHFYIISVRHGRYVFLQDTLSFTLMDNLSNVLFRAGSGK